MQSVGVRGAVQWEAGVGLEELRVVWVRREVLWDARGGGQVGGASGCGLLSQARCALGSGGVWREVHQDLPVGGLVGSAS
jgi:hypothetical protein